MADCQVVVLCVLVGACLATQAPAGPPDLVACYLDSCDPAESGRNRNNLPIRGEPHTAWPVAMHFCLLENKWAASELEFFTLVLAGDGAAYHNYSTAQTPIYEKFLDGFTWIPAGTWSMTDEADCELEILPIPPSNSIGIRLCVAEGSKSVFWKPLVRQPYTYYNNKNSMGWCDVCTPASCVFID